MSEFVNIFVSGTDSRGKDLSVQGFFKKTLVYIDGVCYTQLEVELAELRHLKLAYDNTQEENLLQHTNPELWRDD